MIETTYAQLNPAQRRALDKAEKCLGHSYYPYSGFSVGACLVSKGGVLIYGTNVENAAYSPEICAERSAIVTAKSKGIRHFVMITIIAKGKNFDTEEVTAPCGVCRQVLFEFSQVSEINMEIILSTTRKNNIIITNIRELLPLGFGPRDLGVVVNHY